MAGSARPLQVIKVSSSCFNEPRLPTPSQKLRNSSRVSLRMFYSRGSVAFVAFNYEKVERIMEISS